MGKVKGQGRLKSKVSETFMPFKLVVLTAVCRYSRFSLLRLKAGASVA